jgi:hypothetical protein
MRNTTDTSLRTSRIRRQEALGNVLSKTFRLEGLGEITLGSGVCGPVRFRLASEHDDFRAIGLVAGDDELISQAWDECCSLGQSDDTVRLILGGGLKIELHVIGYTQHALIVTSKSPSGHEFEG